MGTGTTVFGGYATISTINRTINKEYPIVDKTAYQVMGTSLFTATIGYIFQNRKLRTADGWTLSVLDIEEDE